MLKTKLYRPSISADHVVRNSLIDKLDRGLDKPLTLVSAGAGFGKSMLISSWLQNCKDCHAWISLSEEDSDLKVFLSYIHASIQSIFPGSLSQFALLINANVLPPLKEIVHTLINEIDEIDKDFILVLDDYHLIHGDDVHQFLNEILRFPPEQMHLVIITRKDPRLKINSLRVRDRVSEIRMDDLVFSEQDIIGYFKQTKGVAIKKKLANAILHLTEGWVTGLMLTAMAYTDRLNEVKHLESMSKGSNWAIEFLFDEVFSQQSKEIKELLVVASLTNRFSNDLINAIYHKENNKKPSIDDFINWLRKSNMFIIDLDHEGRCYRFHHFFNELLNRQKNTIFTSDKLASYHRRISTYYWNVGSVEEAVDHSIKGDDIKTAIALVNQKRSEELENDTWYNLEKWISYIPKSYQEKDITILLTNAWVYYQQTRIDLVIEILGFIEQNFDLEKLDTISSGEYQMLKGMIHYFSGEGEESKKYLAQSVEKLKGRKGLILGEAELLYALSLQMIGKKEEAKKELDKCIQNSKRSDIMYLTRIQTGMNFYHILAGDFIEARNWSGPMKKVMEESGSMFALCWGEYLDAYVEFNLFNLEGSLKEFEQAVERKYISDMSISVNASIGAVLCLKMMNRNSDAESKMEELDIFVNSMNDPNFYSIVPSCKARLDLMNGKSQNALNWAHISNDAVDPLSIFLWIEIPVLTRARVLVGAGNEEDVRQAIELLNEIFTTVKSVNFESQDLDIMLLLSLAYYKLDDKKEALLRMEEALLHAEKRKWIRPFIEIGNPMREMLLELNEKGVAKVFIEELLGLLDQSNFNRMPNNSSVEGKIKSATSNSGMDLTIRELETVKWLSYGLRNKEIAEEMNISVDAVKKNLYRIFQKTNVRNRLELINIIDKLNLLDNVNIEN